MIHRDSKRLGRFASRRFLLGGRRILSIDALRGLAALVVVLAHIVQNASFAEMNFPREWIATVLDRIFSYGRAGVTLFFLISGFCIHMRWSLAKVEGRPTRIAFLPFWKKRFVRLYPPFLVALGFYLAARTWDGSIRWGAFDYYDVASHLLMLHNFDGRTIFSIEGVFWTLAIEEQLYLAYFLLLPLRERWGWRGALLACLGARVAWFGLCFVVNRFGGGFRLPHDGGAAAHWFVWALGAASVEAALGLIRLPGWATRASSASSLLVTAIACDLASEYHAFDGIGWRLTWLVAAPIWGAGLFVVVNRLIAAEARRGADRRTPPRPIAWLARMGLFSYSTYLMHHFVLLYVDPALFRAIGVPDSLGNRFLTLPFCLACCYAFFILFEKPFLATMGRLARDHRVVMNSLGSAPANSS